MYNHIKDDLIKEQINDFYARITKEEVNNLYTSILDSYNKESHINKPHLGTCPQPLFRDEKFNIENWCSGQDIIREQLTENDICEPAHFVRWYYIETPEIAEGTDVSSMGVYTDAKTGETSLIENSILLEFYRRHTEPEIGIVANIYRHEEQTYIIINVIANDIEMYDNYVITWYKSRGRTESITKNGQLITMKEYIDLINILPKEFFNKQYWH